MKFYKDRKEDIGSSDVAALALIGPKPKKGLRAQILNFGEDGCYNAYIVDDPEVEIPNHYKKITEFCKWMEVYDDDGLCKKYYAEKINVYRAGEYGCIIQLLPE